MADEEEDKEISVFLKLKEMIPVATPFIAIMGIAFTYYSYFYDIQKTPQLQTKISLEKVSETDNAYIVNVRIQLKNESKSRLEIIGNMGRMFSMKIKTTDSLTEKAFDKKVTDTLSYIGEQGFRIDRDMNRYDVEATGVYQPINQSTWMQPQESFDFAFLASVSKAYDLASFGYMIDFSTSKENIMLKYSQDEQGNLIYKLYEVIDNDTTNLKEIPSNMEDAEKMYDEYKICRNIMGAEIWLKDGNDSGK